MNISENCIANQWTDGQVEPTNGWTNRQTEPNSFFFFFFQDSVKIVKSQHSLDIECKTRDLSLFGSPPKSSDKLPTICTNLLFLLTF